MRIEPTADQTSFPADPPPDRDNPQAVAAHDWAAFTAVDAIINHWGRAGWTSQTRAYYWLIPITSPDLADQAQHCQRALTSGFDPIDRGGFHLTLGRVGLAGDVDPQQLNALVDLVGRNRPQAATVHAVPMAGSRGAIRYSLAPWAPILTLHQHLQVAGRAMGMPGLGPTGSLRPHIGIAYSNKAQPAAPVHDLVAGMRELPAVPVRIDRAELVVQRRVPGAYRWQTLHELLLPGA